MFSLEILHGVSNLFNLKNLTGSSQSRHVPSNSGLKRERDEKDLVLSQLVLFDPPDRTFAVALCASLDFEP